MDNVIEEVTRSYREVVGDKTPNYYQQPIPCPLDDKIVRLVNLFKNASECVRQGFLTHDNEDFSWRLLAFAERMASLAVRESSPERLLDGLLALLIGYYRVDVRDVLTVLAIIYDAGIKIGAQPDNLLLDAATMINNSIAQIMLEFTSRTPTNKSLQNFFYKEDHDLDGFRYMRIP